eukprot:scaffold16956_cov73-Attheya_sp.AAC.4
MIGTEEGSTDIDGVDEGLIDGPMLVVGNILGRNDASIDSEGNVLRLFVGVRLKLGPMIIVTGARVRIACISGSLVRNSRVEGMLLRSFSLRAIGVRLGLRKSDGYMLGLEFGPITLNVRSNESWSNPGSVHVVVSNDSFLVKDSIISSAAHDESGMAIEKFLRSRGTSSWVMPYDKAAIFLIFQSSRQYRRMSLPCSGSMNPDAEFCHINSSEIARAGDSYANKVPAEKPPLGIIA